MVDSPSCVCWHICWGICGDVRVIVGVFTYVQFHQWQIMDKMCSMRISLSEGNSLPLNFSPSIAGLLQVVFVSLVLLCGELIAHWWALSFSPIYTEMWLPCVVVRCMMGYLVVVSMVLPCESSVWYHNGVVMSWWWGSSYYFVPCLSVVGSFSFGIHYL